MLKSIQTFHRQLVRGLLAGSLMPLALGGQALAAPDSSPDQVMVLVKFVPDTDKVATDTVQFVPESCGACTEQHDPAYERHNERENILQFQVPRKRHLELAFAAPRGQVRRALVNQQDLPLRYEGRRVIVTLPPVDEDTFWSAALATDIVETGVVLRFEHADVARRGGDYAIGRFPVVERRAADNLTFAQREVIRRLGLGQSVADSGVGLIMLMGFDTNFPANHADSPPHVHMHLRWSDNIGTQIGHYYLGEDGLLLRNSVGVRGFKMPGRVLGRGETYTTIDRRGLAVYSHTITPEGWLRVARADGAGCLLRPSGQGGFDDGVTVDCGALGQAQVRVRDDMAAGVITVNTDRITEVFRYDRDTGKLINADGAPIVPYSARNPEFSPAQRETP